ncbi:MAG: hypothetical protein QOI15_1927 [Pseudonocardiales bacterium]|nr:hypothetical protein [Pseudonocardiales bacterium]
MPDRPSLRRRLRRRWRRSAARKSLGGLRAYLHDHRKQVRLGLVGAGLLVGLGIVWILITGLLARQQAQNLEDRLQLVRQLITEGRLDEARQVAEPIPAIAQRAADLTSGPAWWVGAHLPLLGDPLEVVRGTMAAGAQVGDAVPGLMQVVLDLDPANLRVGGDTVRLGPLQQAVPDLEDASRRIDAGAQALAALPSSTWLGLVDRGRDRIGGDIELIRGYVDAAKRVAQVLPTMLGKDTPQTYFIGLQNEAELRGTGGLPGAFAIARAYHGTLHFTHFYSDAELLPPGPDHLIPTGLQFGPGYDSAYGPSLPTSTFVDSNVSPHFPYAARIWQAMWEIRSGQHVDGVLALDPTVLSYFLNVTGPARLPDGQTINAGNVITLTQRDEYTLFPDNIQRKKFIVAVLKAASEKLTSGAGTGLGVLHAASLAGNEQRLLAWSEDPQIEHVLEQSHFAGAIPQDRRPFSALVLNNASAGKLDFYLTRAVAYERTGCGAFRDVLVTIKLTNNAPAAGLPPYVYSRLDNPPPGAEQGDYRSLIDLYATPGAQLQSVTLDGRPSTASVEHDLDHPMFRFDLELPRAETQTLAVHLREPAGVGTPQIWRQPGVAPLQVQVYDQPCG